MASIELWAGVECTINRVKDRYYSQLESTGHLYRPQDIELFSKWGIKTMRYPCLWEMVCPDGDLKNANWAWIDERLNLLKKFNIHIIAGLLHHGSGPRHTDLCDPHFPEKFAGYARAFAERYPWIEDYTPINEPLTTARFSALYGFWYPHSKDDKLFAQALYNQCLGIILAMKEIRAINPNARLIQTEDLGTIFSALQLDYQAAYENERRWLSLDMLSGRLVEGHPLWKKMRLGVSAEQLKKISDNPCPPNIIGINYYMSSDRFLDHRLEQYSKDLYGGNDIEPYVDIMAAHSRDVTIAGHYNALKSAWERYHLPVALTEVHLDSSRDEQMRWLQEAWRACNRLKEEGVDLKAMTVWSLLGCYDWNTLVTCNLGYYEPGPFDVRSGTPRPTALARMIRAISSHTSFSHPVLETPGWWRRPYRVLDRKERFKHVNTTKEYSVHPAQPLLINGATGTLGQAFAKICEYRGISYRLFTRKDMDIAHYESVQKGLEEIKPWAVVNAAGYVRVERAECESDQCFRENTTGAEMLARACQERGIPLLTFSTDLVFDGSKSGYFEHDQVNPQNVYGKSKAEAEKIVMDICPRALIIRTSSFFGPWDEYNFLSLALRSWLEGKAVDAKHDTIVTPTYVPDLVHTCLDLLLDQEAGIWHITNGEAVSWSEFAQRLADLTNVPRALVKEHDSGEGQNFPNGQKNLSLWSQKGRMLPSLQACLERYLEDIECVSLDKLMQRMSTLERMCNESHTKE